MIKIKWGKVEYNFKVSRKVPTPVPCTTREVGGYSVWLHMGTFQQRKHMTNVPNKQNESRKIIEIKKQEKKNLWEFGAT